MHSEEAKELRDKMHRKIYRNIHMPLLTLIVTDILSRTVSELL